jgi:hypothetical protein
VHASETAPEAMTSVRELFRAKLDETRAQVMRLLQLERDLSESLAYLEGCRVCREPATPEVCTPARASAAATPRRAWSSASTAAAGLPRAST